MPWDENYIVSLYRTSMPPADGTSRLQPFVVMKTLTGGQKFLDVDFTLFRGNQVASNEVA